jgi:hypothetical protein
VGYLGTPDAWTEFKKRWGAVLEDWACPYLHMTDAHAQPPRGAFKAWTVERVRGLERALLNKCLSPTGWVEFKDCFYGVACTINLQDYNRASKEISLKEAEAICVDNVVGKALMVLPADPSKPFGKAGTVELFFDKGEQFMHKVNRIWQAKPYSKLRGHHRLISAIETVEAQQEYGVQAADFLACQTLRFHTTSDKDKSLWHQVKRLFAANV